LDIAANYKCNYSSSKYEGKNKDAIPKNFKKSKKIRIKLKKKE
jgi:hypothetical protein